MTGELKEGWKAGLASRSGVPNLTCDTELVGLVHSQTPATPVPFNVCLYACNLEVFLSHTLESNLAFG